MTLRLLFFLNSLNNLPNLSDLRILVDDPNDTSVAILRAIPATDATTIIRSKLFQPSTKNLFPYAANLSTTSRVKIAANPWLICSVV